MSLYERICRPSEFHEEILKVLEIRRSEVPRFRDAYVDTNHDIVIFTRTGGVNRAAYENRAAFDRIGNIFEPAAHAGLYNEDLRRIHGFVDTWDDQFDSTYAYFRYRPDQERLAAIANIRLAQGEYQPMEKFKKIVEDLKAGRRTEETERALELAEEISKQLRSGARIIRI